jgi:hypothetical protein
VLKFKATKIMDKGKSEVTLKKYNNSNQKPVCEICSDKEKEIMFRPCPHFVLCQNCSALLKFKSNSDFKCPLCRKLTQKSIETPKSEMMNKERLCLICCKKEKFLTLLPCAHFATCGDCIVSINKCPICNKIFEATIRTYI